MDVVTGVSQYHFWFTHSRVLLDSVQQLRPEEEYPNVEWTGGEDLWSCHGRLIVDLGMLNLEELLLTKTFEFWNIPFIVFSYPLIGTE